MWSKQPRAGRRLSAIVEMPSGQDIDAPPAQRRASTASSRTRPGGPVSGRALLDTVDEPRTSVGARRWFATWEPRSRTAALALLAGLGLVIGWWWWSGQPQTVQVIEESTAVDEGPALQEVGGVVLVHVVGQVTAPGVVELPDGARVRDAIEAAGGATRPKALESVNLARPVVDGEQIVVGAAAPSDGSGPVSINSASAEALDELSGVGPVIAERIVQWREANGPFRSVDELAEVSGIGPALVEQLRGQVAM